MYSVVRVYEKKKGWLTGCKICGSVSRFFLRLSENIGLDDEATFTKRLQNNMVFDKRIRYHADSVIIGGIL